MEENTHPTSSDPLIGRTVSHYTILEKIGEGGMGVVYKAEDTKLHRAVALKFLPSHAMASEEAKTRFFHEARAAAALDHANICTVYEINEFDDKTFIAMAYIEGPTLKDKTTEGPLPVEKALEIAVQVADGLVQAHEKGIVHRDIKPSNLKVTTNGQVKIMDFGLARSAGQADITKSGTLVGTVAYMSPEQARGELTDHRTDIWSFGVVMYEMLLGQRPFMGEYEQAVIYSICNEDHSRPTTVSPAIPFDVEAVVEKCLKKDPNERYQTARELLDDLRHIRQGERPKIPLHRGRRRPLPRYVRWTIGIGAVAALALLGAWAVPRLSSVYPLKRWFGSVRIPAERHLAVLPLTNIGSDPANQALCDGLMEYMASKLTQLEQFHGTLWVVPASEVVDRGIRSARSAQREFAVNLAITGSLQRKADDIQLNLNLVDPNSLRQLTSRVIEGHLGDVYLLQQEVISQLAEMLNVELKPRMREVLTAGGTTVPRAHDLYLQGRGYLQRYEEPENIETSIVLFRRALAEDASYALAYAGLGEAFWRRYGATEEVEYVDSAIGYCRRAIDINDQLAPSHITLGLIEAGTGRYDEAEREFQQALNLDPVNADAFLGLARVYEAQRSYDQAEATYRRAIELRPSYWAGYNQLGFFYYKRGHYDDAVTQFREVVNLTPYNLMGHNNLGGIYYLMERWDDARQMFERSLEIKPNYRAFSNLGTLYVMDGRYEQAADMYRKALELDDRDYRVWAGLGAAYHRIAGQADEAEAVFRQALERAERRREINPHDGELLCHIAGFHQTLGESDKARELLRQALELLPNDLDVLFHSGTTYEALGDRDKALELITKALRQGYSMGQVERDRELDELRKDPRFEEMLRAD